MQPNPFKPARQATDGTKPKKPASLGPRRRSRKQEPRGISGVPDESQFTYVGTHTPPGTTTKVLVLKHPRRPMRELGRFFMASQACINEWATQLGLSGLSWRVFLLIASRIDYEDGVVLSSSEIGAELGVGGREVRRAVSKLAAANILTSKPSRASITSPRRYFLNPFGVARGKAESVSDQQQRWKEWQSALGQQSPKLRVSSIA